MNIIPKTEATRLRACKLVSDNTKLAIAQTNDADTAINLSFHIDYNLIYVYILWLFCFKHCKYCCIIRVMVIFFKIEMRGCYEKRSYFLFNF